MGNSITQKLKYKQSVIKFSYKYEEFSDVCFGIYIMNLVYITLSKAFNEIRNQIECITK